jgi:putative ABC transport system permease protein
MQTLWQDLRYGLRMLRRNPGFTVTAVLTLALGIGVNTTIFTLFEVFLRPLPVKDPKTVVQLDYEAANQLNIFSFADYVYLRDHAQVLSGLVASSEEWATLGGRTAGEEPQRLRVEIVSDNFFSVLGASTVLGRTFTAEENGVPGRDAVVILNHRFWQRQFAGDPNVLGRTLAFNGRNFTIIGVMERSFVGLDRNRYMPDIWLPLMMRAGLAAVDQLPARNGDWFGTREARWLSVAGRLKPGRTVTEARAEVELLMGQLIHAYAEINPKDTIRVTPAGERNGASFWQTMAMVMAGTGLVLLIACSNIANLLLARAAARQKEIGVRLSLGASRARVVRQLLTEGFLLAGLGGGAGLLLAWWSLVGGPAAILFSRFMPAPIETLAFDFNPDARVLTFTFLISALSGLLFTLLPALRATGTNLVATIRDEGAAFGQRLTRSWLRNGLVVAQVTLSLVLLISAGLLLRGLMRGLTTDPGFEASKVLAVSPNLELGGYDALRAQQFQQDLMARVAALPRVERVSVGDSPLGGAFGATLSLPGENGDAGSREHVLYHMVTQNYFETVGIPLIRGRGMTAEEMRAGAEVVVVSETTARNLWPNQDPLGKILRLEPNSKATGLGAVVLSYARVVGVARDAQTNRLDGIPPLFLYAPVAPRLWTFTSVLARTSVDAVELKAAARAAVRALDPSLRTGVWSVEEDITNSGRVDATRAASELTVALGLLALLLAAIGLYGVMSYAVSQRAREIGIRMALGAQTSDVLKLVFRQGMALVLVGGLFGLGASLAVTRLLNGLLFGLSAADPLTFGLIAALLTSVASLACYLPARRATKVDPLVALRYE